MDLMNMVDCKVKARKRGKQNILSIDIESMRFDKTSKLKIQDLLQTKSPNSGNMVLRVSCILMDHDSFRKIKPGNRFFGNFYPDAMGPFEIRDFDIYFKPEQIAKYADYIEISDASMIAYAI